MDWPIPPGYRIEESEERVPGMKPVRCCRGPWAKLRAKRTVRLYPPMIPSYRLVIERRGPWAWDVVPLQNRLVPIESPSMDWFRCDNCERVTQSALCGCPNPKPRRSCVHGFTDHCFACDTEKNVKAGIPVFGGNPPRILHDPRRGRDR